MLTNAELWKRIDTFELDDPNAASQFTDRLARENRWPRSFAKRAVQEYKRFVYLAAISRAPVTPSDVVDQVWHLHLTFTRSYWDGLCNGVLRKPLHHGPTMGGRAEDAKYRTQYAATRALYRAEFGTEPPLAFWPHETDRFAAAQHQRWVDTRTHLILRKPKLPALWSGAALATTGASAAMAADGTADANTTAYVLGGVAATALLLLAALFSGSGKRTGRKRGKNGGGDSSFIATTTVGSSGGKGKGEGAEGGEGGGGEGGDGDGGSGCGGGGGCGSS